MYILKYTWHEIFQYIISCIFCNIHEKYWPNKPIFKCLSGAFSRHLSWHHSLQAAHRWRWEGSWRNWRFLTTNITIGGVSWILNRRLEVFLVFCILMTKSKFGELEAFLVSISNFPQYQPVTRIATKLLNNTVLRLGESIVFIYMMAFPFKFFVPKKL